MMVPLPLSLKSIRTKELLLTEERRSLPPMTKGEWALFRRVCKKEGLLIPDWTEMEMKK